MEEQHEVYRVMLSGGGMTLPGQEQTRLRHDSPVWAVAFSPDGTRLATGSTDNTARLWTI